MRFAPVAPAGYRMEATGPPAFLGNLDCPSALLYDPGDTGCPYADRELLPALRASAAGIDQEWLN